MQKRQKSGRSVSTPLAASNFFQVAGGLASPAAYQWTQTQNIFRQF